MTQLKVARKTAKHSFTDSIIHSFSKYNIVSTKFIHAGKYSTLTEKQNKSPRKIHVTI